MRRLLLLIISSFAIATTSSAADNINQNDLDQLIHNTIQPVIKRYDIPGMAVAITIDGKDYFYNYGVASKQTKQPVSNRTLFEIGSVSKTFTVTLASYAEVEGKLSFTDKASKHLPALRGSKFDDVTLINLGTHTSGGLPLQVPDHVADKNQLMAYYKEWQPGHATGSQRTYSNLSIGMLSMIAARSMNMTFEDAMEKKLFPELGMKHSYIRVPAQQMKNYAQGYTSKDEPVRMNPGVLASETYGIKSNSKDLIRFIAANMQLIPLEEKLQRAINKTHTGYFKVGEMTQDLIWEQFAYPVSLKTLLADNAINQQAAQVDTLTPPLPPQQNVLINKTGGTGGFSTYVVFIPAQKIGIVMLANKNYPIDARVEAAYQILKGLETRETASKEEAS